ncbi:MAG: hypothetical protein VX908_01245 [Planctomycetota bacterium]|nr:hypothetical protein [Planctomycetota bacterium]
MKRTLFLILLAGAMAFPACTTSNRRNQPPPMRPEATKRLQEIAENELSRGSTFSIRFQAQLQDVGEVPYDQSTLPLVSPDGNYIATSVGIAPEMATLLAEPGSPSPLATGVEIWKINQDTGALAATCSLNPPLLLGRSADTEGFLVESPTPQGPRKIGKVSWTTGELTWLVDDENVNAFATLGPRGQLAYSTRPVAQEGFSLVVRNSLGNEIEVGTLEGNWYFPTWSTRNDRLYAFWISPENHMRLVSMLTISQEGMSASMNDLDLGENATPRVAYRAVAVQPVVQGLRSSPTEELLFWHPGEEQLVAWSPGEASPFILMHNALAAVHDVSGRYIVTTADELRYVDPTKMNRSVRLHDQVAIPFRTTREDGHYLLLTPGRDRVSIRALIPMHRRETVIGTVPSS